MLWIWVVPSAILAYAFVITNLNSSVLFHHDSIQERLSYYFGWGCKPREHCIAQLLITMPFYASVAYSLGALVARKTQPNALKNDSGIAEIALGPD